MVTGRDCPCTDTTEPSNITSLQSDDVLSAVNTELNAISAEIICEKENNAVEEHKGTHF